MISDFSGTHPLPRDENPNLQGHKMFPRDWDLIASEHFGVQVSPGNCRRTAFRIEPAVTGAGGRQTLLLHVQPAVARAVREV